LATIVAKSFKDFSDEIEKGKTPKEVAREALKSSWKTVFNGNCYDATNQANLIKAGVWNIPSCVDAIERFSAPENIALFTELKVFSTAECLARQKVLWGHYIGVVEIEVCLFI